MKRNLQVIKKLISASNTGGENKFPNETSVVGFGLIIPESESPMNAR